MREYKLDKMIGGWFIGNFEPSILKTKDFEVAYKKFKKGKLNDDIHFHKIATEYNLIIKGSLRIDNLNKVLTENDIFVFEPGEISNVTFLEDTNIVVVKTPSVENDKYFKIEKK